MMARRDVQVSTNDKDKREGKLTSVRENNYKQFKADFMCLLTLASKVHPVYLCYQVHDFATMLPR